MEQDNEITVVIFRKWRDKTGDILALFPYEDFGRGLCSSYMHIGQHGGADYITCIHRTVPAKPVEYAELKTELENIGYKLKVEQRRHY